MEENKPLKNFIRNEITRQNNKMAGKSRYTNGKSRSDRKGVTIQTEVAHLKGQVASLESGMAGLQRELACLKRFVGQSMVVPPWMPMMNPIPQPAPVMPPHAQMMQQVPIGQPVHQMYLQQHQQMHGMIMPGQTPPPPQHLAGQPMPGQSLPNQTIPGQPHIPTQSLPGHPVPGPMHGGIPMQHFMQGQQIMNPRPSHPEMGNASSITAPHNRNMPAMDPAHGMPAPHQFGMPPLQPPIIPASEVVPVLSPGLQTEDSRSTDVDDPMTSFSSEVAAEKPDTETPEKKTERKSKGFNLSDLGNLVTKTVAYNNKIPKTDISAIANTGSVEVILSKGSYSQHNMTTPAVTRKKSGNAWFCKREDGTQKDPSKVSEMEVLRGNIVAILNKITPQNFKDLSVQILQLQIDNKEKLEVAVEIIFEKVLLEPAFSETYAHLCKVLGRIRFPEEQNATVSPFRQTLLNRVKNVFFMGKSDIDKMTEEMEALKTRADLTDEKKSIEVKKLMDQRSKLKKRMLGNINFIGELFNLGMLSSRILIEQCIEHLLEKRVERKLDEEFVECVAQMFSKSGSNLEKESTNNQTMTQAFDKTFSNFKDLAKSSNYAPRIKFMIQDIVELRENNWVPRRVEAKPQRIEDIHREHAKEEQQKRIAATSSCTSRNKRTKGESDR